MFYTRIGDTATNSSRIKPIYQLNGHGINLSVDNQSVGQKQRAMRSNSCDWRQGHYREQWIAAASSGLGN